MVFRHLTRAYQNFQQTLIEANYHPEPRSLWSVFKVKKEKLPETAEVEMGHKMLRTSTKIGSGFIWAPLIGLASIKLQLAASTLAGITGGVLGVLGAGLFTLEYIRSKRAREEIITEVNFAGQKVQGSRADLCRLYQAQVRMMNLTSSFKMASLESTADTIQSILDGVREEQTRVKILDAGAYGAGRGAYEFSRPTLSIVGAEAAVGSAADISAADQRETKHPRAALRGKWKKSAAADMERKIEQMHKALPPHIRRKVDRALKHGR